jgi:hypothetical protein
MKIYEFTILLSLITRVFVKVYLTNLINIDFLYKHYVVTSLPPARIFTYGRCPANNTKFCICEIIGAN